MENHVGECFYAPEFTIGERVKVREGPLAGLIGIIDEINRKLLRVCIDALPGSIVIEIDPRQLQSEESGLYKVIASN